MLELNDRATYIKINGKEIATYKKELSYENIVDMSGKNKSTVIWTGENSFGILKSGQKITMGQCIIFNTT